MNLTRMKDAEILSQLKILVQNERNLLTQVLHHLREVEKRRLFSELRYSSLFDYAINELKYSESQAHRRISAMRLLKELPQVEDKIQSGTLNLSNLCQAQTYFKNSDKKSKTDNRPTLSHKEKIGVLEQLENKSAREGEKLLLSLQSDHTLPPEKLRKVTADHTEVRFVMNEELRKNLEQVRTLLGLKGLGLSFAELANEMALMSAQFLKQKTFGKKRIEFAGRPQKTFSTSQDCLTLSATLPSTSKANAQNGGDVLVDFEIDKGKRTNYISQSLKFQVWERDKGKCTLCSGTRNLNYDHIHPKVLGGENTLENLRLLCFHCNQRRAQKTFKNSYTLSDCVDRYGKIDSHEPGGIPSHFQQSNPLRPLTS